MLKPVSEAYADEIDTWNTDLWILFDYIQPLLKTKVHLTEEIERDGTIHILDTPRNLEFSITYDERGYVLCIHQNATRIELKYVPTTATFELRLDTTQFFLQKYKLLK